LDGRRYRHRPDCRARLMLGAPGRHATVTLAARAGPDGSTPASRRAGRIGRRPGPCPTAKRGDGNLGAVVRRGITIRSVSCHQCNSIALAATILNQIYRAQTSSFIARRGRFTSYWLLRQCCKARYHAPLSYPPSVTPTNTTRNGD
jgi:hypothetical protein